MKDFFVLAGKNLNVKFSMQNRRVFDPFAFTWKLGINKKRENKVGVCLI